MRTLAFAVLGVVLLPLFATAAPAARPEKPPAGMGLYIIALHDPLPPARPGKDGPPDIPALGGRVLQKVMNRQLVHLPLGVSKTLRKNDAVAYVQRVWTGESASEWDEQDDSGNGAGRVAANAEGDGPTWFSGDYAYDGAGNITAVGGSTYSYDSAGRLIKSTTAGRIETYGYDSFGNRTSRALDGGPAIATDVDPATNRLTGRLHDGVGNVTTDRNGVGYEYDAAGMKTGMTATNGQRRRMFYTADDERIATATGDLTRVRIRDFSGKVLRELLQYENQSWAEWRQDFVYANGVLVGGEREGSEALRERHYHLDHLGSVRLITTANGMRVSAHEYLPFGTEVTDRTQEYQTFGPLYQKADPMKFTSHERDVTGLDNVDDGDHLDYMHARYYDSLMGRFLSVDPVLNLKRALREPQNWNRYAYVMNNPLKYTDPTGKDVSIRLNFTGDGWTDEQKKKIIAQVTSWYQNQKVGKVYVFDGAKASHGGNFLTRMFNPGYVTMGVSSGTGPKNTPSTVYAGNFSGLPAQQRLNAISNSIIHETAAHRFHGTYLESADALAYARGGLGAQDPQVRQRYGTVADSYMYADPKARPNVVGGPIPIHPGDQQLLRQQVGPHVEVEPPDDND